MIPIGPYAALQGPTDVHRATGLYGKAVENQVGGCSVKSWRLVGELAYEPQMQRCPSCGGTRVFQHGEIWWGCTDCRKSFTLDMTTYSDCTGG